MNKRLLKVPLDLLQIQPIREPTPSICLEGISKENSEEESQEKSTHESDHSERQYQNGEGNKNKQSKKDRTESTEETIEEALAKKQIYVASTLAQSGKALVIDLEQGWEQFNKKLLADTNLKETSKLQTPKKT